MVASITISPLFGEGLGAQTGFRELRDMGIDSYWDFIVQEIRSPCPSLFIGEHSNTIN